MTFFLHKISICNWIFKFDLPLFVLDTLNLNYSQELYLLSFLFITMKQKLEAMNKSRNISNGELENLKWHLVLIWHNSQAIITSFIGQNISTLQCKSLLQNCKFKSVEYKKLKSFRWANYDQHIEEDSLIINSFSFNRKWK